MTDPLTHHPTTIEADPELPLITISREFDAPPERVFRAHVEPDLVARWLGPSDSQVDITGWDASTGGHYRYTVSRDGEQIARFYGSFHEVRPTERIVQTFTWEGMPDGVSLDTVTFIALDGDRTLLRSTSLVDSMAAREAILASGMETGVEEGYDKLDEVLARG